MTSNLEAEETVRLGEKLYIDRIQRLVEPDMIGQYVAIDVTTGDFVVSQSSVEATDAIHKVHPEAVVALLLVGYDSTSAIGARLHRRDETQAAWASVYMQANQ